MKKTILFSLIATTGLVSCKKEVLTPTSSQSQIQSQTPTSSSARGAFYFRVFYDNGGQDYGCRGSGGNCADDIVVSAHIKGAINGVFGSLHSGNDIAIQTVFENYKNVLINHMDEGDVDGVIRGNLKAKARGTNPTENRYIILTDASTDMEVAVYPFVK